MTRYPRGITLSPEARAQAGYGPKSQSPIVWSHDCQVTLPDGSSCPVAYQRLHRFEHTFSFGAPLGERLFVETDVENSTTAIERLAEYCLPWAWKQAQESERQQMGQKTRPKGEKGAGSRPDKHGLKLTARQISERAGRYAVCVRLTSGRLLRLGPLHERPEAACAEVEAGAYRNTVLRGEQQLVVGLFDAACRCWREPRFLVQPVGPASYVLDLPEEDISLAPTAPTAEAMAENIVAQAPPGPGILPTPLDEPDEADTTPPCEQGEPEEPQLQPSSKPETLPTKRAARRRTRLAEKPQETPVRKAQLKPSRKKTTEPSATA